MCDTSMLPSLFIRLVCLQICSASISDSSHCGYRILVKGPHMIPSNGVG